jgi:hypothetical protein
MILHSQFNYQVLTNEFETWSVSNARNYIQFACPGFNDYPSFSYVNCAGTRALKMHTSAAIRNVNGSDRYFTKISGKTFKGFCEDM